MTESGEVATAAMLAQEADHDSTATDQLAEHIERQCLAEPDEDPPFPDGPNGDLPPSAGGEA